MKKKKWKLTKEQASVAVIIGSALICLGIFLSDAQETALNEQSNINEALQESPIGEIAANMQTIGSGAVQAQNELEHYIPSSTKASAVQTESSGTETTAASASFGITAGVKYEVTFVRAKDGDTYVVNNGAEDCTVRLIGVDTPESVAPSTYSKDNTEEGKEVSDIVKAKFHAGDTMYIEFDAQETDRYGRYLCYVYLDDGTMVQDWLLTSGYANIATYPPNVKYVEHFMELAHQAAEEKVGLWNGFFTENE